MRVREGAECVGKGKKKNPLKSQELITGKVLTCESNCRSENVLALSYQEAEGGKGLSAAIKD